MELNPEKQKPKNKTEHARSYFGVGENKVDEKGEIKTYYQCKVCNKGVNGTKQWNLVNHLQSHKDVYKKICALEKSIEEKRLKLLLDCVELVTVNGQTFTTLNKSGFLSILNETMNELTAAGRGVNLDDPRLTEVKSILHQTADCVKRQIKEEVNDTPLTLMVDITTKNRRSIMGVSVQFIVDGKTVVRSIGMLELKASHTGEYLAMMIFGLLQEYNIKPQHVISITTDNGSNVLKMVRDLSTQMAFAENQARLQRENAQNMDLYDSEIDQYLETVPDISDEEALNLLFEQTDDESETNEDYGNLLEAVLTNLSENVSGIAYDIGGVNCLEHTLQLIISDGLKGLSKANKNVVELARRVAKTLRLKSTSDELSAVGIKFAIPHIEVVTRWSSLFTMLSDVFECIEVINYYAQKGVKLFSMVLTKMKTLKELIRVLGIANRATIALQAKSLTLSDAYGILKEMKLHLEACTRQIAYKTKLPQLFLEAMAMRQNTILKNPYMECCLFLDPRYRTFILRDHDAVERARAKLVSVWYRLNPPKNTNELSKETANDSSDLHFSFNGRDELNKLISQNENAADILQDPIENANTLNIEDLLHQFQHNVHTVESSVLEFWNTRKDSPLYKVAMAIFSIPPTQVQIERDFSSLGHVFGARRYRLSQELLQAILLLHLNKDVFFVVKKQLLEKVKTNQYDVFQ